MQQFTYYSGKKPERPNETNSVRKHLRAQRFSWFALVAVLAVFLIVSRRFIPGQSRQTSGANSATSVTSASVTTDTYYMFRYPSRLENHFAKHGSQTGHATKEEYLSAANAVIANPAALHKTEAEDGDDVYFLEDTGEIVFVSTDGYIRTYFISNRAYFDRQ